MSKPNGANGETVNTLPNHTIHITGHNDAGLAVVRSSKPGDWQWFSTRGKSGFNVVYTTSQFPVDLNDDVDIATHEQVMRSGNLGLVQANGTVCRIVDFAPGGEPLMHRTQSLDYGIVLEGEIEMELDDGSVTVLKRGDVAVQRATNHAWRNTSKSEFTRMLFVLQDCKPVFVGGRRYKEDLGFAKDDLPKSGNDGDN